MSDRIDAEIRRARTLPSAYYTDSALFETSREAIFASSWHFLGSVRDAGAPGATQPFELCPGALDEPLLLTRDHDERLHLLSNVCTHRGNLVADSAAIAKGLRCRYHGRRFSLDGRCLSMPEFEQVEGFPSVTDNLPAVPHGIWKDLLFAAVRPRSDFDDWIAPVAERVDWIALESAVFDPTRSRDYSVNAHWALYCDNYLEGFHIPFVHAGLAGALDYGQYSTELFDQVSLQLGIAADGEDAFEPPPGSPDHRRRVAAYYFFLFPATMLNIYPWGLSVNMVQPLAVDRTRVLFRSYVLDPSRLDQGAGAGLDRVEQEDEEVVESVQRGVRSRLYDRGRYSPTRETAVHHFHRLLLKHLS